MRYVGIFNSYNSVTLNEVQMASIRYVATGKTTPKVTVSYSRNGGKSWQENILVAGQTFHIPPGCTNLLLNNVPYDHTRNMEIREGRIAY